MRINDRLALLKAVAVNVVGFIKRHKRLSVAAVVALLIAGPLLTGAGGETFFLNLVGLGVVALVVRRILRANQRRQARQPHCRCHCLRQQPRQQHAANQREQQRGTP